MLDYKQKYKEIKTKLIESTDVAYRLGFEAGLKQATQDQMQMQVQQAQQAQMQMQAAMQGGNPQDPNAQAGGVPQEGAPMGMEDQGGMGFEQPAGEGEEPELAAGEVGELDQYINELENLVAKGEKPSVIEMRNKVTKLAELRKNQKAKMKANKPQVVSAQKKLVDNILSKWEKESKMTSENLEDIVKEHGIKLD